jgi:hypothetical protein
LLNQPFFTIEPEFESRDLIQSQRQCAVCGDTWIHGPDRVPFRIVLWRSEAQIGDLCEACLRGGSHAALNRVIERIQMEKQIIAKLDALVSAIAGMAPAAWNSAIAEWERRQNSLRSHTG